MALDFLYLSHSVCVFVRLSVIWEGEKSTEGRERGEKKGFSGCYWLAFMADDDCETWFKNKISIVKTVCNNSFNDPQKDEFIPSYCA